MVGDRLTTGGVTVEGFISENLDPRNLCFALRFLFISSNAHSVMDFRGVLGYDSVYFEGRCRVVICLLFLFSCGGFRRSKLWFINTLYKINSALAIRRGRLSL